MYAENDWNRLHVPSYDNCPSIPYRIKKNTSKLGCFWVGRNGMKQKYELKKLVTVSELWISDFFLKPDYVYIVNKPIVIFKNGR